MLTRRALLAALRIRSRWPRPCRASSPGRRCGRGPSATAASSSCSSSTAATTGSTPSSPSATRATRRHRRELRLPTDELLQGRPTASACTRRCGAAADLLENGRLAIVQGVGYPNPDRSHFESMAIWQTARPTTRDRSPRMAGPGPRRHRGRQARQRRPGAVGRVHRRARSAAPSAGGGP